MHRCVVEEVEHFLHHAVDNPVGEVGISEARVQPRAVFPYQHPLQCHRLDAVKCHDGPRRRKKDDGGDHRGVRLQVRRLLPTVVVPQTDEHRRDDDRLNEDREVPQPLHEGERAVPDRLFAGAGGCLLFERVLAGYLLRGLCCGGSCVLHLLVDLARRGVVGEEIPDLRVHAAVAQRVHEQRRGHAVQPVLMQHAARRDRRVAPRTLR